MRPLLWLMLLTTSLGGAAEWYGALAQTANNRLANAGFEPAGDGTPANWQFYQEGGLSVAGEGRSGAALRCLRPEMAGPGTGVSQSLTLNQTEPLPLLVTGYSRAEGVNGRPDPHYSIYCDLEYTDGTPLWGQTASFSTGTHGWQRRQVLITPTKPIKHVTVYALFREHRGTVWFDDFELAELAPQEGAASLDGLPFTARAVRPTGPAQRYTAGNLALALADGQIGEVSLGGQAVTGPHPGGFMVRDAAAQSGFHGFEQGRCPELGLRLDYKVTPAADHLLVDGVIEDTRASERAVTLVFALPLEAVGWRWGRGLDSSDEIGPGANLADWQRVEAGSNGQLSTYPFANVSGPSGAINLGIDMAAPCHYRLGYSASARLLYLAMDLGLTPLTRNFPSRAPFRFVLFPSAPGWGFRAALQQYTRIFPESFRVRTPDQGIWMAFAAVSRVEGWEDFGFKFKEGDEETAWDDAHGLLTFRYSEMGTFWMPMPKDMPREYEEAVALLKKHAEDPNSRYRRWALATLNGGMQDAEGRFELLFRNEPWCDGAVFSLNPSPHLEGPSQAEITWGPTARKSYQPGTTPVLDGEYFDSLEGYVTAPLNYRGDHLAVTTIPLTFTSDDYRPVLYKAFSIAEICQKVATDVHAAGRLMMANGMPYRYNFLATWFDVMGTETDWGRAGQYTPDDDRLMGLRRACAVQRPYLLLLNTRFADFGPYVERYFQRALAYGMYPSMFSHNAAEDHYFQNPAWYNRDRELFKRYIPRIREVAEEGWEPLTGVRCDNPAIHLERFGPGRTGSCFVTVHNNGDSPQRGRLTFEDQVLGRSVPPREVSLAPWETQVLKL
ncbi:MAG: hypothetical protein HUU35_10760 [Armatimonadetes bacterium]|nr:hypothetical protein [Armatimonadota bacterium]